jgi:hypothetical protein
MITSHRSACPVLTARKSYFLSGIHTAAPGPLLVYNIPNINYRQRYSCFLYSILKTFNEFRRLCNQEVPVKKFTKLTNFIKIQIYFHQFKRRQEEEANIYAGVRLECSGARFLEQTFHKRSTSVPQTFHKRSIN